MVLMFKMMSFLTLLISFGSYADIQRLSEVGDDINLLATNSYTLSSSETIRDAEIHNIEQIKANSADYVGSFVESKIIVINDQLTKRQVSIAALGFVEIVSIEHSNRLTNLGHVVVESTAIVSVSKKSVFDSLENLKVESEKNNKIEKLERQNKSLQNDLSLLVNLIKDNQISDVYSLNAEIIFKTNEHIVDTSILVSHAQLTQLGKDSDYDYELARNNLLIDVIHPLLNEVKVKSGNAKVIKQDNGKYELQIPLFWDASSLNLKEKLEVFFGSKRFRRSNVPNSIKLHVLPKMIIDSKAYTERLRDFLFSQQVVIEVDLGFTKKSQEIKVNGKILYPSKIKEMKFYYPIAATSIDNDNEFVIQVKSDAQTSKGVRNFDNPVVINGLSEDDLKLITSIKTKVFIVNSSDNVLSGL